MKLRMTLLLTAFLTVTSGASAGAATIRCGMNAHLDRPAIDFGEISEDYDPADFNDAGKLGVTAIVTGNGKTATFSGTIPYIKVGGRIEPKGTTFIDLRQFSLDEFQSEFGMVPEVKCTTP